MTNRRIMVVFGTRPEAIKMCPLIKELQERDNLKVCVCVTGQHRQMLDQVLEAFSIIPDYDLSIMKETQTLYDVTCDSMIGMKDVLEKEKPDMVLVHGDTTTTFATAVAAFYKQIPVGHVEAGLRTYNLYSPYPEEFNRQAVSVLATLHFAPTETARTNLIREGKSANKIFVTGNTAIDALKTTINEKFDNDIIKWVGDDRLVVLTAHRRENLGEPIKNMFRAIKQIVQETEDVKVVYPVHLNPAVRNAARDVLAGEKRIRLIEPLDVMTFHNLLAKSYLILTDSGGIQEEAPSLGKPVLVLRDTTERPEGVEAGTLRLVGTAEKEIYQAFKELLENEETYEAMSTAQNPYGDGLASQRICDIIEEYFC